MPGLLKRFFIGLLLLLTLCVGVGVFKLTSAQREVNNKLSELRKAGKPVSVNDIAEANPPVSPAVKTLEDLSEPLRLMDKNVVLANLTGDEVKDKRAQLEAMRAFDSEHRELIALLREAADDPLGGTACDLTSANVLLEDLMNAVGPYKSAARALAYHADVALEDGKTDEAMLDAIAILGWADHIGRDPSLLGHLTHLSVRGMGLERAARCLYRGDGSAAVRQRLVKTVSDYDRAKAWTWAIESERAISLGLQDENFGFAKHMMTVSGSTADMLDSMESYEKLGQQPSGSAPPPSGTTGLQGMINPALEAGLAANRRMQTQTNAILILAAWQDAGDDQATDIDALGLPIDITNDPMDGSKMKFRLTDKGPVIYGVGRNGVDDGGALDDYEDAGIAPQ